jgi:hypothetical protein
MTPKEEGMMRTIGATDNSTATTILRLVLGVVFPRRAEHAGVVRGVGFSATMAMFTGT